MLMLSVGRITYLLSRERGLLLLEAARVGEETEGWGLGVMLFDM